MAMFRKKKKLCPHCGNPLDVRVGRYENTKLWSAKASCSCGAESLICIGDQRSKAVSGLYECIRNGEVYFEFPSCPYCGSNRMLHRSVIDTDLGLTGVHVVCRACGAGSPIKQSFKEAHSVAMVITERMKKLNDQT